MKYRSILILTIILIVATILRVYRLDQVPPSLFGDEIDVGYQAYSLLKTGQDLHGQNWPTLIHSLSEYRAPLFIYSAVPFVSLFGLNEWGVRLPAAFFGIMGVLGIFLLSKKLFNEKIGLFASCFLAISPWHLQYSRAGFEVTMLLTFLIFGTYFFLLGLARKWWLILAAVFWGLTPYIYSTAVVFTPLLMLTLLILFRKQVWVSSKYQFSLVPTLAGMVIAIILIPYIFQIILGSAGERFNVVSIFGSQDIKEKVFLAKQLEDSPFSSRIFHSVKLTELQNFTVNYFRAYSPEFLLIGGDPNQRHSVGDMGELYFFEASLILLGILGLLKGIEGNANKKLVLAWLLLAPVPAALTYDGGFHGTRNFLLLFPMVILSALGASYILKSKWRYTKYFGVFILLIAVMNVTFYIHRYYQDYPKSSWLAWHYGFKEVFKLEKEIDFQYKMVLINNTYEPSLIRFLFWSQYNPEIFHQQFKADKSSNNIIEGFDGFSLDKYYFGKFNGPFEGRLDNKTLWIASARDDITNPETLTDSRVKLLEIVYSPSNEPIFYLITGKDEVTVSE